VGKTRGTTSASPCLMQQLLYWRPTGFQMLTRHPTRCLCKNKRKKIVFFFIWYCLVTFHERDIFFCRPWVDNIELSGRQVTGARLQQILFGRPGLSISEFGLATSLLRFMECDHVMQAPLSRPRHYLMPEFAVIRRVLQYFL
jgi:hypothetical protein